MILIISSSQDTHAAAVMEELRRLGATGSLLDLSSFPQHLQLSFSFDNREAAATYRLKGAAGDWNWQDYRVIWWRRPQPFALHQEVANPVDRAFALTEAHAAFSGLWLALDPFWINHPTRDEEASRKVYQLTLAQAVGFRIPQTLITSNPADARAFIDEQQPNRTVYKAFAGTEQAWRETRLLKTHEVELLDHVRFAPVIFQEYIPGIDLRVTIVGDEIFPAAIRVAASSYQFDFRMSMDDARIEPVALPDGVESMLRGYMKRLGLAYGAVDMRRTPDGDYVFLEINPSGQWLFVEQGSGQGITAALARLMVSKS